MRKCNFDTVFHFSNCFEFFFAQNCPAVKGYLSEFQKKKIIFKAGAGWRVLVGFFTNFFKADQGREVGAEWRVPSGVYQKQLWAKKNWQRQRHVLLSLPKVSEWFTHPCFKHKKKKKIKKIKKIKKQKLQHTVFPCGPPP